MAKQHDDIARRIAKKVGGDYNPVKGPDIVTPQRVIEVGTDPNQVSAEMKQVARYNKPRYVAGPKPFVKAALKSTQGTGIGVMDGKGNIVKRGRSKGK